MARPGDHRRPLCLAPRCGRSSRPYAPRQRLVQPDAADEEIQLLTKRLTPGLAGYLALILAGLFIPVVAVVGYLVIALYYIIPLPRGFSRSATGPPGARRAARNRGTARSARLSATP